VSWQRHLGEIRIQTSTKYRSHGLGKILAGEVFNIAREIGLSRLSVQMTTDQRGGIATFEGLGFQREAVLQDYVIDRNGRTRDLLVMGYDVTGLTEHFN
jgi:ribosomal protein S18 acetylase RimI-like enzyme